MSYMESQMQFQIEASIELEKAICDDACDIFKETGIMPLDMKMQRDELQSQLALMKDRIDSLEKDAARLMFVCEFDGYIGVEKDKYDYACECMDEAGRDEPNDEDELNGLRRLIDAAMEIKKKETI